jgi:hypothetical protein
MLLKVVLYTINPNLDEGYSRLYTINPNLDEGYSRLYGGQFYW